MNTITFTPQSQAEINAILTFAEKKKLQVMPPINERFGEEFCTECAVAPHCGYTFEGCVPPSMRNDNRTLEEILDEATKDIEENGTEHWSSHQDVMTETKQFLKQHKQQKVYA
jgi:hypothetical protein